MRYDLKAFTDVAGFAFYDPAAVPHLLAGSIDVTKASEEEMAKGRMLAVKAVSDGDARLRVYVEEDPPEELRRRREHAVGECLLRVPSGRLVFSGLEDLWKRRKEDIRPGDFSPATGAECTIPPGDYLAEAISLVWGDDLELAVDEIKTRADRFVHNCVGPLMGLVVFGTVLVLPGVLLIAGWRHVWSVLKYALIVHAAFWPLVWLYFRLSGAWSPEYRQKEEDILAEHPTLVLSLRKLPGATEAPTYSGGPLYSGYGPSGPPEGKPGR